jgi:uncharacterized membrane protein YfcA
MSRNINSNGWLPRHSIAYPLFFLCLGIYWFWFSWRGVRSHVLRRPWGSFRWYGPDELKPDEHPIAFWIGVVAGFVGGGFLIAFSLWAIMNRKY